MQLDPRRTIALLAAALLAAGCSTRDDPPPRRDILLITLDTLRTDRLGSYGHHRLSSPGIDGLAQRGVVFERALSQAPWTLPSMASLHTSRYPSEHGALDNRTPINPQLPTLAELLTRAGYHTVGVVQHSFVSSRYGFASGFAVFDETPLANHAAITSPRITERALAALRRAPADTPVFVWVHYFDPHLAYRRHRQLGFASGHSSALAGGRLDRQQLDALGPEPSAADLDYVKAVYDEEVAYTDLWISRLLAGFDQLRGSRPAPLVVLTADHGEYFMERGRFGHGQDVYHELVRVPLIISGGGVDTLAGTRLEHCVEVAELARTIASAVGADASVFRGRDLLALAHGEAEPGPCLSEGSYAWGDDKRKLALIEDGWKLILNLDDQSHELFDLERDPAELSNLWSVDHVVGRRLRQRLDQLKPRPSTHQDAVALSEEDEERLRSLGYLH